MLTTITLQLKSMSTKELKVGVPDFNNHLLQLKSVAGVLSTLEVTAKKNGGRLDFKQPQVCGLVDGLGSPVLSTASSSAALLVSALQRGWLDFPSLLSTLVSQAALVPHYAVAVHTITSLLLWEAKVLQLQHGYQCPYSLKINIHPFISVLNSRIGCGWCAISELKQVYNDLDNPCVALKMVEPFIKYVLVHPSPSSEVSHIGHSLQSELISIASASLTRYHHSRELAEPSAVALQRSKTILQLFIRLIPLLPTKSDPQLASVASLLERIVHLELEIHQSGKGLEENELIDMCLSYLCELTERGLPYLALFDLLFSVFKNLKHGCSPHHWLALSWLILENLLNPQLITRLLDLCTYLDTSSTSSPSAASLLCYSLVQLLAQPTSALLPFASHDVILSNQKTASTLLKRIEGCLSDQLDITCTSRGVPRSCSRLYLRLISTLQLLVKLDAHKLQEITNKFTANKSPSHGSQSNIVLVLSVLALKIVRHQDIDQLKGILSALTGVAKSDPSESPSLLPFFLYLQSVTQNPQFKVSILYSIPTLATHRASTVSIVSTIQALGSTPSLLPLAIRLMDRLWQHQDHVFPFLNELLSRVLPPSLPAQLVYEVTLARAIAIRDVCQLKAEVHGEEMLNHISKFLLVTAGDPLPVAMVIEGLVALCECEVTDVGTLWGVLGGQHHSKPLLQDNRTPVVIALCGLFELASDVDTETRHANNVFKVTALKYLWNCACSEDTKVCSAAFRALSKFKLEDYLPEHLSPKVVNKIGLLSDGAASGPLCGKNCVELVHHIPVECAEAFGHFLTSLIGTELKGVQRGVVYSALREMQVPSQAERALQSVTEVLPSLCSANINRDIKPVGLIKGTMMLEYHCERRSGRIGRQALSKELDQRQAMLETFLREVTLYTGIGGSEKSGWMGLSCLYLSEQWKGFVGKLLDTYCLFRLLDTHSVSVEEDLKDPLFLKKKTEAQDWSMSQLLDKLNSFARNNSECAPDMLLVVAGIISTRSATCCSEGVGELLSLLMDMVEGCTAVLMGQKPQPSPSASDTIVQALLGSVHPDLPLAVVLSAPHLVDSIMALHWDGLTDNVSSKLVALIDGLFEHFQRSPQWYTAVVLNHVLMKTLPTVDGLRGVMIKLIPFLEASTKSNSLELLSLTSGLVPALLLYGNHSQLAEAVLSVLQQKLSSLSLSELATAPAQVCSLNLAGGVVSLYASRRLSEEEAMLVVTVLAELATKAPQLALLHLSLSISLCGLGAHGCQKALSLADTIAAKWIQEASELVTTEEATDKVIPVLCGLSGLVGVNPLHCGDSNIEIANIFPFLKTLYSLVAGLLQKYVSHQDNTVCSSSVWLLSQVHSVVSNVLRHEEKVPLNYSYLSDDSVLNNLYVLLESLSSPPYHPYKIKVLNHLLKSLLACEEAQLPPADFSGLLAPLLVHRELEQRIIGCLVQLSETQGLRQLASYTCTPLVFSSLKTESKCVLLENVTVVLQILPIEQFTKFLQSATEESLRHLSGSDEDAQLQSLLTGAVDALSNTDISYEAKKGISAVTVRVFTEVCGIGKEASAAVHIKRPVLEKLAASLSHCDPKQVSLLCEVSQDCPVSLKLCVSAVMHCCWVKAGVRKVKTLIRVVEWILNTIDDPGIVSPLSWLLQAIVDCCSTQSSKIYEMNQSDFLLILSAWTKTAKVVTSVQADMLLLLVTLVCGGSNAEISHHLDIAVDVPREQQVSDDRLQSLVDSQSHLLTPPESQPIREKLCLFLLDLMNVPSLSKDKVLGLILALKSTAEFSAPLIWTSIAQWWDST